jgi:hypothetical protein
MHRRRRARLVFRCCVVFVPLNVHGDCGARSLFGCRSQSRVGTPSGVRGRSRSNWILPPWGIVHGMPPRSLD